MPSLAISDLAFSPTDPTHQTLYAATGSYSGAADDGGPGRVSTRRPTAA